MGLSLQAHKLATTEASDDAQDARSGQVQIPLNSPTKFLPRQTRRAAISKIVRWKAAKLSAIATYLLELLDGTLVDTAALVDQVCDVVSLLHHHSHTAEGAYVQWWSTCRSRRGR